MKESNEQLFCSFCGKPKELVKKLIAGPNGIYICNECIEICGEVLKEDEEEKLSISELRKNAVKEIREYAKIIKIKVSEEKAKEISKLVNKSSAYTPFDS